MKTTTLLLFLLTGFFCFAQDTIPAITAKDNLETIACVTGKVVSIKSATEGKTVNYLNLEEAFPNAVFTVVMTNKYLEEHKIHLNYLLDKVIYVTGRITTFKNDPKQTPQIFNPRRIEVKNRNFTLSNK